jgi:hypothetical protein
MYSLLKLAMQDDSDMDFGRFCPDVYGFTPVINESTGTALGCRWVGKARKWIDTEKVAASALHSIHEEVTIHQYPFYG